LLASLIFIEEGKFAIFITKNVKIELIKKVFEKEANLF